MKNIKTNNLPYVVSAALIGSALTISSALATPVDIDIAGDPASSVSLTNIDTGLSVLFGRDFYGIGEDTSITAVLADGLGDNVMTLNDNESSTIDFLTFTVAGSGIGSFDIGATLAFDTPTEASSSYSGAGGWLTGSLFNATYSAGALWWVDPIKTFSLDDGNVLRVELEQGFVFGKGSEYTLSATITNLGGGESAGSIPEPMTMVLFGTGIIGLGAMRRLKMIKK